MYLKHRPTLGHGRIRKIHVKHNTYQNIKSSPSVFFSHKFEICSLGVKITKNWNANFSLVICDLLTLKPKFFNMHLVTHCACSKLSNKPNIEISVTFAVFWTLLEASYPSLTQSRFCATSSSLDDLLVSSNGRIMRIHVRHTTYQNIKSAPSATFFINLRFVH